MRISFMQGSSRVLAGLISLFIVSGCAATQVALSKKDLDVQTVMSDSIFLDPVASNKMTIYIRVRNTSDKTNFDIEAPIKGTISARGYKVTTDPDAAHYWLQASILSVAKASPSAIEAARGSSYGGAVAGAVAGAVIGSSTGGHGWAGAGIGGLVGGAAEVVAGSLVKDVTYMAVTDIEISEKASKGVVVRTDSQQDAKQGLGGSRRQTSSEVGTRRKYRTRIVSTANKVNLNYEEAAPLLTQGLTRSIAGLF